MRNSGGSLIELDKYPAPHPQVAGRTIADQAVVVLADAGQVNVFNSLGTRIWELIDGAHSVQQIVDAIVAEYDVAPEVALQDATSFLQELVDTQAITLLDQPVA